MHGDCWVSTWVSTQPSWLHSRHSMMRQAGGDFGGVAAMLTQLHLPLKLIKNTYPLLPPPAAMLTVEDEGFGRACSHTHLAH